MRFSLRALLALTLLVFLALLAWRAYDRARRDEARVTQLQHDISLLESRLRLDDPVLHQAILHELDEAEAVRTMQRQALVQFEKIRQKYDGIERRGADVFSMRSLPALPNENGTTPTQFRLIIPAQREVWLKFGVVRETEVVGLDRIDKNTPFLKESPFRATGPFEQQLKKGEQVVTIAFGPTKEDVTPLTVAIDDRLLFETQYVISHVTGAGSSHISAREQVDYPGGQPLPTLMSFRIHRHSGDARQRAHNFVFWLSDEPSGFAAFPRPKAAN